MAQPLESAPPEGRHSAAQAQRLAERERIQQERQAIMVTRKHDETACYRRFAVEDCLRDVRTQVRNAEVRLRARELQINDAERKEKAAERLRSIEEKQRVAPDRSQPQGAARAAGRSPASVEDMRTQHQREAQQRAQQQRSRQDSSAANKEQRATQSAERAAAARARHAENVKSAQERRERQQKMQAESAAAGRKPAAPLPASSGLAPATP
jgi:hypothetical protein